MVVDPHLEKNTSSITKITRPEMSSILLRSRLFRLIDKARNRPIIWIAAPPGSGKTTLTASYIASSKLPCLWYQIDKRDTDVASFFHYLNIAVEKTIPNHTGAFPTHPPTHPHTLSLFSMRYFEELYRRLKPPFFFVLDDYQEMPCESEFHDVIVHGLCKIPEGINVMVMSRNEPPPQFIRLRANNMIHFIGWDEIRFTVDEFRKVVRQKKQKGISDEVICQLHERTHGWIAGIVILMDAAKTKDIQYHLLSELTPREIFDYFMSEVFSKVDEETQSFLRKTSFLTGMTQKTAERLTGMSASGHILSA